MGGSMGNPIDEAAQARINQKIEDVVKTFGVEFSKVMRINFFTVSIMLYFIFCRLTLKLF
jgi:hypothetical protein